MVTSVDIGCRIKLSELPEESLFIYKTETCYIISQIPSITFYIDSNRKLHEVHWELDDNNPEVTYAGPGYLRIEGHI